MKCLNCGESTNIENSADFKRHQLKWCADCYDSMKRSYPDPIVFDTNVERLLRARANRMALLVGTLRQRELRAKS